MLINVWNQAFTNILLLVFLRFSTTVGHCLFYEISILFLSSWSFSHFNPEKKTFSSSYSFILCHGIVRGEFHWASHGSRCDPSTEGVLSLPMFLYLSLFCRYSTGKSGLYSWSIEIASQRTAGLEPYRAPMYKLWAEGWEAPLQEDLSNSLQSCFCWSAPHFRNYWAFI